MKAILFSLILFLASCTKQYELPVKTDDIYHGYPIELLQRNVDSSYRVTIYIGNNTYRVHPKIDRSKVSVVYKQGTAYFYQQFLNGAYLDRYIIEIPTNFSITNFIN